MRGFPRDWHIYHTSDKLNQICTKNNKELHCNSEVLISLSAIRRYFLIRRNSYANSLILCNTKRIQHFAPMIKCIWVRAQYGNHVLHAKIVTCHVTCGVFMSCHMWGPTLWGVSCVVTCVVYHVLSHVWYIMCSLLGLSHIQQHMGAKGSQRNSTGQDSAPQLVMPQFHPLEPRHLATLWVIVVNHVLYAKIVTCWAACVTHGSGSMVMWACLARNLPFAPQPSTHWPASD